LERIDYKYRKNICYIMPVNKNLTNLQRANISRSLVAEVENVFGGSLFDGDLIAKIRIGKDTQEMIINGVETSAANDQISAKREWWPFETGEELSTAILDAFEPGPDDAKERLRKTISDKMRENLNTSESGNNNSPQDNNTTENSNTTSSDGQKGEESDSRSAQKAVETDGEDPSPKGSDVATTSASDDQHGSSDSETPTVGIEEAPAVEDGTAAATTEQIATELYKCFISRGSDGKDYETIVDEYNLTAPKEEIVLTEVLNTAGSGEQERIEEIEEWVKEWYGDEQEVANMDRAKEKPLGAF
jgi:hypothetical protein